jgi:hypothetical protein
MQSGKNVPSENKTGRKAGKILYPILTLVSKGQIMKKFIRFSLVSIFLISALKAQTQEDYSVSIDNFSRQLTAIKDKLQNLNHQFAERIQKDPYESSVEYEKKLFHFS